MEKWDLYNADGTKADGFMFRGEDVPAGLYTKSVSVLVRHTDGDYLLTQRCMDKTAYPGWYEATSGGAVLAGETEDEAVRRELFEETGLTGEFCPLSYIKDDESQAFRAAYLCTVDSSKDSVVLQESETDGYKWLNERQFITFVNSPDFIPVQRPLLKSYFEKMGYITDWTLEKMGEFFDDRLPFYDQHQLNAIKCARDFYPYTAECLPKAPESKVLDLGCGTGLELGYYFDMVPDARVTGIDLAEGMLGELRRKFNGKALTLINGSYFDVPLGESVFDAAVSVESLHHFTADEKLPLYTKLHAALKDGGYFILTDYMVTDEALEKEYRSHYIRIRNELGLPDGVFYHYDTPLTVEHETGVLKAAGFSGITVLNSWENTYTIKAVK